MGVIIKKSSKSDHKYWSVVPDDLESLNTSAASARGLTDTSQTQESGTDALRAICAATSRPVAPLAVGVASRGGQDAKCICGIASLTLGETGASGRNPAKDSARVV